MKTSYFLLFLFTYFQVFSQVKDSFSDGNFSTAPRWIGDTALFLVNPDQQLQSAGKAQSETIFLATSSRLAKNAEWQFWLHLPFNPSTSNYAKLYLTSSDSNLTGPLNGYFLKIGGSSGNNDAIELYKQYGSEIFKLATGKSGLMGKNSNTVRLKVTRDTNYNWKIYADTLGNSDFILDSQVQDSTFKTSSFIGIACNHTSTRGKDFYFDDFLIKSATLQLEELKVTAPNKLQILFNKRIEKKLISNRFSINGFYASNIASINDSLIELTLSVPLLKGRNSIAILGLSDLLDEDTLTTNFPFQYSLPLSYGSLIITEIYADPTPSQGLPGEEYVELFNTSTDTINLDEIIFCDPRTCSDLPQYYLPPGEYLILCPTSSLSEFKNFGRIIGLSPWPSLNNASDSLSITQRGGQILHSVNYSNDWFTNRNKIDGGWALEMIDTSYPCNEKENWDGSVDLTGGTPGKVNSIKASKPDLQAPEIEKLLIHDKSAISIIFNEKLDTSAVVTSQNILINPIADIGKLYFENDKSVRIIFTTELALNTQYKLSIKDMSDCNGNFIKSAEKIFALPAIPKVGEILINEVLFNPHPGGIDFIELYNNSDNFFDLSGWTITNLNQSVKYAISESSLIMEPHQYLVLTADPSNLFNQYPQGIIKNFLKVKSMPPLNDDEGNVTLFNISNDVFDQFSYSDKMHHKLIKNTEGISLERILFDGATDNSSNWHSAATDIEASPGYKNSQLFDHLPWENSFSVQPTTFSPNGDGKNDFTLITYDLNQAGNMASINVYDALGRNIKRIAANELLGKEGFFQWDGLSDDQRKADTGMYLLVFEIFTLEGDKQKFRKPVILSY